MNRTTLTSFFRSPTARLAGSYLAIIMVLSVGFSSVLYQTSARELARQEPPPSLFDNYSSNLDASEYHHFFQQRIDQGKDDLLLALLLLNILVLMLGSIISYYLARRALTPIEEAMEAQSRFVADASHELRTPLTAILASNEVALRDPRLNLAKSKKVIASNMEEAAKLRDLTEGLLSLAALDNNGRHFEAVSLQTVTTDALNRIVSIAQAKHIAVDDQVPDIKVTGDRQSLAQALGVLLENAIKYSAGKSTVSITAHVKNQLGYLEVRDTGSGIDEADLTHIFNRFYRADQSRNKADADGYGIGLSIAQKIVEQHGGTISVTTHLGRGSTFRIALLLARS